MGVCNHKDESNSTINSVAPQHHIFQKETGARSKFNTSAERKIERLRIESNRHGWSYNDFVVRLLEVLVVLNHRNNLGPASTSQPNKKREIPS